jgi:hypothetical protein
MRLSNRFACASTIEISPSVNELRKTLLRTLLKVGRYIYVLLQCHLIRGINLNDEFLFVLYFEGDNCSVSRLRRKQMVPVWVTFVTAPFTRVGATWCLGTHPSGGRAKATTECWTEISDEYEDVSGVAKWLWRTAIILAAITSSIDGTTLQQSIKIWGCIKCEHLIKKIICSSPPR